MSESNATKFGQGQLSELSDCYRAPTHRSGPTSVHAMVEQAKQQRRQRMASSATAAAHSGSARSTYHQIAVNTIDEILEYEE